MPATASTSNNSLLDNHIFNKDYPRSPSSISPTSSRRDSLRSKHADLPAPNSPPARLSRKRAGSLDTDTSNHPRIEDLALSSGSIFEPKTGIRTDHVCLCQPDPKIPRPRNAFILYRQHYQAQVVAQHPGLANPEISKIIGEQWRDQSIEVKNDWKRLAEEEKQRHQRQYPDYRYQPRRAGKPSGIRPITSSGEESTRCPKCGGRYISTPNTPLTPFTPSFGAPRAVLQPSFGVQGSSPRPSPVEVDRSRFGPAPMQTLQTLHTAPLYSPMHRRPQLPPQSVGLPMRDHNDEMDMMSPSTPYKRRRFESDMHSRQPSYPPTPGAYPPPPRSSRPPAPISAVGYTDDRRRVFQVQGYHHTGSGMMDPPPRPSPPYIQGYPQHPSQPQTQGQLQLQRQPSPRNTAFDESLRLPPLQTQIPNHGHHSRGELGTVGRLSRMGTDHNQRSESYARSVQAMVMTIPYLNKIKVLAKISPPLATPSPTSPIHDVRGAVIAIEGADLALVAEVGKFLEEHLSREAECLVRAWSASASSTAQMEKRGSGSVSGEGVKSPKDSEMSGVSSEVAGLTLGGGNGSGFLQYLNEIQAWHGRSAEMVKFITTPAAEAFTPTHTPVPVAAVDASEELSPKSVPATTSISPNIEPATTAAHPLSPSLSTSTMGGDKHHTAPSGGASLTRIPIALLPAGFSLLTSDAFASSIPINDAYAPVDHWQWMATLWRGIVGPDLTIYVKGVDTSAPGLGGTIGPNGEGLSGREEMGRYGGVEIRHDCRAVVVRVEKGTGTGMGGGNGGSGGLVEEKTLRRLGFEVLEFVRSEGGREGSGFGRG